MINIYLSFCQVFHCNPIDPSLHTCLCYLEFLSKKMKSPKTVSNYWASVKLIHSLLKVSFTVMDDIEIQLFLRSVSLSKRHVSKQMSALTKKHLGQMCRVLDTQGTRGLVLKTALTIGFFAFLRGSNLCPQDAGSFDCTRHFTRSDVQVTKEGLVVKLKWAKNMQSALQQTAIPIPRVKQSHMDPTLAFVRMCNAVQTSNNQPLFMLDAHTMLKLDDLRCAFKLLCVEVGLDPDKYSVHSLRRGGATEAYAGGASALDIKRHGAWSSDCFLNYVATPDTHASSVCTALS